MDRTHRSVSLSLRTAALTAAAMVAFAANSLLCRLALEQPAQIDAASFGSLRLVSGALVLALIVRWQSGSTPPARVDWPAAGMLFAYVACFSFAYLTLSAGTGALLLFGAVQLTMLGAGLFAGERFAPLAWAGLACAAGGLVYLVWPGLAAPPLAGALLMAAAGVAWGGYSLRGRAQGDPLRATAGNFARAALPAVALSLVTASQTQANATGVALAVASGALSSALGYVIWYAALQGLTALRAASVQLSVPPLAALGGAWWLGEAPGARLVGGSLAILGGIALVLASRAARR